MNNTELIQIELIQTELIRAKMLQQVETQQAICHPAYEVFDAAREAAGAILDAIFIACRDNATNETQVAAVEAYDLVMAAAGAEYERVCQEAEQVAEADYQRLVVEFNL